MNFRYTPMPPITAALATYFNDRVDKRGENDCWLWRGSRRTGGYGQACYRDVAYTASRIAFYLANGELGRRDLVCHHCDNRLCCNPKHLFIGTHTDNMVDMARKGRGRVLRGEANPRAKLTADQVRIILASNTPAPELARRFQVNRQNINAIRRGETWKHLHREHGTPLPWSDEEWAA